MGSVPSGDAEGANLPVGDALLEVLVGATEEKERVLAKGLEKW